jgi:hypothetical protein
MKHIQQKILKNENHNLHRNSDIRQVIRVIVREISAVHNLMNDSTHTLSSIVTKRKKVVVINQLQESKVNQDL